MGNTWAPASVVGGSYSDDARPWSVQDCVNWIPVISERQGGRSPSMLRSAPGAVLLKDPATGEYWSSLPFRGMHDVEGKLCFVAGSDFVVSSGSGWVIERNKVPGTGRVTMAHNQISGGFQVVIANGTGGYVYDTNAGTFSQITDEGFPGFKVCDYVDSYIVGVEPYGRFWFHSELADAMSYNTLDRYEAESQPDKIVGLVVVRREVFVLGQRTGEFFANTGAATGTFQRKSGTEMDVGCAATHSVQRMDNTAYWLGNDGAVYRLNGYSPERISTRPIEQDISKAHDLSTAFAVLFEDRGHKLYCLTIPGGHTWCYDASTGEWMRRESNGLTRWRFNCTARFNGGWAAGDYTNGKLYMLDWDKADEDGAPMVRRRVTGVLHGNQNRLSIDAIELVLSTSPGEPITTGGGYAGPSITEYMVMQIRYSKDGGNSWSNWCDRSLWDAGRFIRRVRKYRLGQGRQWVFDIQTSAPITVDLMAMSIQVKQGKT